MKNLILRALSMGWAASIALSACSTAAPAPAAPASGGAVPAPTVRPTQKPAPTAEVMNEPAADEPAGDAMMDESPDWFNIALTDVNSGEMFNLADFKGQVVLVEGMAVWCTNCLRQQRELVGLHEQIGDAAISVAIDVDLNEDEALLKAHAERNGFDWRYAVASPELAQAFADEFGAKFLNPPNVPMFLIDPAGGVHLLDFGHKSADYLTQQIQAYQN